MAKKKENEEIENTSTEPVVENRNVEELVEAINVLIGELEYANSKGVFSFEDSSYIYKAITIIRKIFEN